MYMHVASKTLAASKPGIVLLCQQHKCGFKGKKEISIFVSVGFFKLHISCESEGLYWKITRYEQENSDAIQHLNSQFNLVQ